MPTIAAAGGGFLLAVLWFDLMFDVQVRGHGGPVLPDAVLTSIRTYYRRVTTDASPMSVLISAVMVVTLGALVTEVIQGRVAAWASWASLGLVLVAIGLAASRTVRNARRLALDSDSAEVQSGLARGIYRDHLICLGCVAATVGLQIAVGLGL